MIRLFGVNAAGNSVCAHVHNFTAYFYIHVIERSCVLTAEEIEEFRILLNKQMHARDAVLEVELVEKYPLMHYQAAKQKFLKVYCSHPQFVARLRSVVEKGISIGNKDCLSSVTYESAVPYALRFMIDNEIGGMSWVRIDAGNWTPRQRKESHCQIEFDVHNYNHVQGLPCEGAYSKLPPLRILSFDIECSADAGKFPTPQTDPVIQIANIVKV